MVEAVKIEDKEYKIFINDIKDEYKIDVNITEEDKIEFERKIINFYLEICNILSKKDNEEYFNEFINEKFNGGNENGTENKGTDARLRECEIGPQGLDKHNKGRN